MGYDLQMRAWLIASSEPIPSGILLYNSAPILAQLLPPKKDYQKSPIIAGSVTLSSTTQTHHAVSNNAADPWAQYLATQGRSIGPTPAPRVVGPTETKFQEQEGKLHAMEVRLASMEASNGSFQTETQKQIAQLDASLRQQAHDTQNRILYWSPLRGTPEGGCSAGTSVCPGSGGLTGENHEKRESGDSWHLGSLAGDVSRESWP